MEIPISIKLFKNILISRVYEQFSRNDSAMAPEWLSEKISNFLNMNILYIALKHIIRRFRICNYFREMFKFREICFCLYFREIYIHRETIYINGISRSRDI